MTERLARLLAATEGGASGRLAEAEVHRHLTRIHPRPELHVCYGPPFVEIVHVLRDTDRDVLLARQSRSLLEPT